MDADGLDLLLKEEPGSPAGMDLDALLMPQVLDRCGVCHQPCPPEEAKSLASCLRCSSKVHGRCDRRAADALKAATYLAIKNEPEGAGGQQQLVLHGQQQQPAAAGYLCPTCVQQAADACPLDLLQLHAALLADIKPRRPRSAADIHAAELTRKHLAAGGRLDMTLLQGLIGHAWAHEGHKGRYDALADKEDAAYQASLATYDGLYQQYASLAASMGQEADISLSLDPQQHLAEMRSALTAAAAAAAAAGGGSGGGGRSARVSADGGDAPYVPGGSAAGGGRGGRAARVNLAVGDVTYLLGSGGTVTARDGSEVPQMINVTCNGTRGVFHLGDMKITCLCPSCAHAPASKRIYTPTQFEQHGGCGTAKKWRISIRIEPGAVPEVARYANAMTFGRWMEMKGIEAKGQRTPASTTGMLNAYADGPHSAGRYGSLKSERGEYNYDRGGSPTSSGRGEEGAARPASAANILPRNRRPESWAPWEDVKLGNYKPVQVRWAGDRCCVCDSDVDYDCDQLVSCEGCGVTVHQSCYGVPELPDEDDMWLCRSCELKEPGAPEPQCCLCPLTGGGLKPTTLKGMWAHAACMQWIPEVTCLEPLRMEPIDRIQYIQKERWELLCVICRQRMGAKIQCHECYQAYHPLCARRAGLHMEMAEPAVPNGPLQLITYCPRHCKARVGASGITLVNEEEAPRIGRPRKAGDAAAAAAAGAAANSSAGGLLNAQPFRPNKPAAPIPAAPGGCARASPLSPDDTQRVSHGTGTGATTVAGFWIPTTESAAAAASRRGWGAAAAGGGWYVLEDDPRPRKRGRPPGAGKPPRPAKPAVYRGGVPPADQPPPEVELLPLPEGCPDRVLVQCNSRRGVFIVRSQKVEDGTRGGTELTPSRFEAVAGKAEAKKWRSSLWAVGEDGTPECQMGDWLARFKLDKAALAKLTANFNAWQLRQLWEAEYTGEGAAARAAARVAAEGTEGGDAAEPTGTEGGTDAWGGTEGGDAEEEGEEEEEVQQAPPSKRQRRSSLARQGSEGPAGTEEAEDGEEEGSEQQQVSTGKAGAAAAGEDDDAGPASKKQKRGASADANGNSPAAAAAAADDAKQQEGGQAADAGAQAGSGSARSTPVTKLKRLHLLHLPLGFRVHPAALPPRAAAAAAARQKQLLQQQQEKAAADAAAAAAASAEAVAGGEGPAAAGSSSSSAAAAAPSAVAGPPPGSSSATVTDPLMAAVLAPKTADSAVSAVRNPWLCVGQCCRVFWVDDDEWYDADVTAYDPASKKHTLWYHADEIRESIDLRTEEQQGRLQWLPLVDKSQWPAPPLRTFGGRPQQQQQLQQQGAAAGAAAGGQQQQQQQAGPPPEPIPPGFPHLTAMHRDPSPAGGDSERADLVGLSTRRAPLSQQLQAMLMLQQENHKRFSTQQPPRHLIPTGQAAVGWRVGLFRPEVGVYYYGMVASYDPGVQLHMVNFDDGAVEVVPLQKQRVDWVLEQGGGISAAAQALHSAYLQSRGEVPPPPPSAAAAAGAAVPAAAGAGGQLLSAGAGGGGGQQQQQLSTGPSPDAPKQVDVICGPNQAVFDCVRMAVLTAEGLLISPTEFERLSGKGCSKKWKATIRVRKANGFPGMTMGDWLLQMGYEQPRAGGADGAAGGPGGRSSSLNDIRRRQFSRSRAMAGGVVPDRDDKPYQPKQTAPNRGTTSHRPNCMCVICKQARRKAAQAAGVPYVEEPATAPEAAAAAPPAAALAVPAGKAGGSAAAAAAGGGFKVPAWLIGKRAYVRAVPHLVRGAMRHDPWEVPESTCYTAAEWEAAQAAEDPSSTQAAAAAAGAGSSRPGTPALSSGAGPDTSRASTPVLGDPTAGAAAAAAAGGGDAPAAAGGDGDVTFTDTAAAAAAGAGAEGDQQQQGAAAAGTGAAAAAAGPPGQQQQQQLFVKGSRSTTWRSKLRVCQSLEPRRITFGKSGIHGWGIFARRPIPADTMVTEFRGQLIRGILADVREAEYRKQHRDCYMFHATAGTVIDNTERGNTSRFTNHCCSPCLYVKVLELQGELHLCFFAKRDIAAGQELTFDYRFKEEDSDSKVLCQCAAPNCKGTLN